MNKEFIKKNKYLIIIICLFVLLMLGFAGLYFLLKPGFKVRNFSKEITVNYNSNFANNPGKACYGNEFDCSKVNIRVEGKVDSSKIGKYKLKYIYTYKGKEYTLDQVVVVKDIEKPKIEVDEKTISVCPNGKVPDFNIKVTDNFDKNISEKIEKTFDKERKKVIIKVVDSSKNESIKEIDAIVEDKVAPEIIINGGDTKTFTAGFQYNDEGASVKDNCDDDIKLETSSDVDYNTPGTYHITYSATDSSNNKSSIQRTINIKAIDSGYRVVYLTFDDGPSDYTNELLDLLARYNVKVTFFVTGNGSDDVIAREHNEGHKIALHTNSHNYSYVYSSIDNYYSDLYAVQDRVRRITGESPNIIRFPGGSSNTVSSNYQRGIMSRLVYDVENRGFHYFDWNVSSGDGGGEISSDQVYNNVISSLKEETSIVLQHDTKKYSIDAVARIIEYCQANGYTFKTIDETTYPAHHGVNN